MLICVFYDANFCEVAFWLSAVVFNDTNVILAVVVMLIVYVCELAAIREV